jgi:YggT family protein
MLIINTLFDLYILLVLLRFLLQMTRADFYNPISQFIVRLTTPPLRVLRRFIPSIAGQDAASIFLCLLLIYAKFMLLRFLEVADLIALLFTVFLVAVIIHVIISWISPGQYNPVIGLVNKLAAPVLGPIRKFVPPLGGIDLTPLFASLLLLVAKMLIVPPIIYLGSF